MHRCEITPTADHQFQFSIDGKPRLNWCFAPYHPRPFFYPLVGPGGGQLTRMGHPGAPDHDHHRSIWFAHEKVLGINFWADGLPARIRQTRWLCLHDGEDEAVMAVELGWFDGHDPAALLSQELVCALRPLPGDELFLELQSTFRPAAQTLEFGKTNFGFLAVRVAKSVSAHFGGGLLTDSENRRSEAAVFGQRARWVDYSGRLRQESGEAPAGLTYFDHPSNPGHPTHWHVRDDGWFGASACFSGPLLTTAEKPLVLRYGLHAHQGEPSREAAEAIASQFSDSSPWLVEKSQLPHQQFQVRRG